MFLIFILWIYIFIKSFGQCQIYIDNILQVNIQTFHLHIIMDHLFSSRDQIVYSTDQYLKLLLKNCPDFEAIKVIENIVNKHKHELITELQNNKQYSQFKLKIISIQSYLKSRQKSHSKASQYYRGFQDQTGIRIQFQGDAQSQALRIYHTIQKLLKRHPISMLQLTEDELTLFRKYYKGLSHVQYVRFGKRCIFFYEIYQTADIKKVLEKKQYHITENDIDNSENNDKKGGLLEKIYKNQKYFQQFIQKKKFLQIFQLQIKQNKINFLSNEQNYQKMRQTITQFLQIFSQQLQKLNIFKSQFQESIFFMFYHNKIKKVTILKYKNQIAWKKLIYESDQIEDQITQVYHKMNKFLVLIPSSTQIRNLPKYMRTLYNPNMTSIKALKYNVIQVNDLFKVTIRNFGSVHTNQDIALFLIHKLEKCQQFSKILQENDVKPLSFKESIKGKSGNKYVEYLTLKSQYFNRIIGWPVNVLQKNVNRVIRDLAMIFQERFKDEKHIIIIIPQDSEELIKYVFPLIFDQLFSIAGQKIEDETLRTIDLIVNFQEEKQIIRSLKQVFKELSHKSNKIISYNPIFLTKFNIKKILEYKYVKCIIKDGKHEKEHSESNSLDYSKEHFIQEISVASSFLLYYQLALNNKNLSRTIIISTKHKRIAKKTDLYSIDKITSQINTEFIIDWHSKKILSIIKGDIQSKAMDQLDKNVHRICKIITDYIANIDSFIICGNQLGSILNNQFYYLKIQNNKGFPRKMKKIIVDMQRQRIVQEGNRQYDFDLILNEEETRFLIETHQKCKKQVSKLLANAVKK